MADSINVEMTREQFLALIAGAQEEGAAAERQRLLNDTAVANAMAAVRAHTWTAEDVEEIPNQQLHAIVRIVLGSVGGAQ
jgi:hypothetical protein